jgi:hypothetical protein
MRHRLFVALLLVFAFAHADEKPGDSNPAERTASKASKGLDNTANRAGGAVGRGLDKAGKWVSRTGERTGKAVDGAANKASGWVKKKTE